MRFWGRTLRRSSAVNTRRAPISAFAKSWGVAQSLIQDLARDQALTAAPLKLKPLLAICRKLTLAPTSVCRADIEAAYGAGWDDDAVNRAVMICGMFNMMCRWIEGVGMKTDVEEIAAAADGLLVRGYWNEGPVLSDENYRRRTAE